MGKRDKGIMKELSNKEFINILIMTGKLKGLNEIDINRLNIISNETKINMCNVIKILLNLDKDSLSKGLGIISILLIINKGDIKLLEDNLIERVNKKAYIDVIYEKLLITGLRNEFNKTGDIIKWSQDQIKS